MGRWTQYDEDDYRLPEGMKRVGYDADTQQYTYKDTSGTHYQGEPRAAYGTLYPVNRTPTSTSRRSDKPSPNTLPRASSSRHTRSATQPAMSSFRQILPAEAIATTTTSSLPPRSSSRGSNRLRSLSTSSLDNVATSLREKAAPVFRSLKRAFTISRDHSDQKAATEESVSSPRSSARSSKSKQSTRSSADGTSSYDSASGLGRSRTLPVLPRTGPLNGNGRKTRDPMVWPSTLNKSMTSNYPEARASNPIVQSPSTPTPGEKSTPPSPQRQRLTKKPLELNPPATSSRYKPKSESKERSERPVSPSKSRSHKTSQSQVKASSSSETPLPSSSRKHHSRTNSRKTSISETPKPVPTASTPAPSQLQTTSSTSSRPPTTKPSLPIYEKFGSANTKVFTPFKPLPTSSKPGGPS